MSLNHYLIPITGAVKYEQAKSAEDDNAYKQWGVGVNNAPDSLSTTLWNIKARRLADEILTIHQLLKLARWFLVQVAGLRLLTLRNRFAKYLINTYR